ncbi:hypothetical protein NDU88_004871 [Pleurodeles waltl]|uniref:Uncharacterized protein n=1 Tax=Pleurodeles waltl TaxID=8319 RepID=A0AAV7LML3_PLEWA|nr:hypothetical protein NDU88_004871 [Pleurodeles waltl]
MVSPVLSAVRSHPLRSAGGVACSRWSRTHNTELPAVAVGPEESCEHNGPKHDSERCPGVRSTQGTEFSGRLKKRRQCAAERNTRVPSRGEQDGGRSSDVEWSGAAGAE